MRIGSYKQSNSMTLNFQVKALKQIADIWGKKKTLLGVIK